MGSYRQPALLDEISEIYNHYYGISLFHKKTNYIECFEFAAPFEKNILNIYFNHLKLIKNSVIGLF